MGGCRSGLKRCIGWTTERRKHTQSPRKTSNKASHSRDLLFFNLLRVDRFLVAARLGSSSLILHSVEKHENILACRSGKREEVLAEGLEQDRDAVLCVDVLVYITSESRYTQLASGSRRGHVRRDEQTANVVGRRNLVSLYCTRKPFEMSSPSGAPLTNETFLKGIDELKKNDVFSTLIGFSAFVVFGVLCFKLGHQSAWLSLSDMIAKKRQEATQQQK